MIYNKCFQQLRVGERLGSTIKFPISVILSSAMHHDLECLEYSKRKSEEELEEMKEKENIIVGEKEGGEGEIR